MISCENDFRRLLRKIRLGTTRFRSEIAAQKIRTQINKYASRCDATEAEFLNIFLEHSFGYVRVPDNIVRLKALLNRASPRASLEAYQLLAKFTLLIEPLDVNIGYRQRALELSRDVGFPGEEFTILVHWLSALIKVKEFALALKMLHDVEESLIRLNGRVLRSSEIYEVHSRFLTHQAKLAYWQAIYAEPKVSLSLINIGNEHYQTAVERDKTNDHRRVNAQIEWAQELVRLKRANTLSTLGLAENLLNAAERSLDSHICIGCPAYFAEVNAEFLLVRGDEEYRLLPEIGIKSWRFAKEQADQSIQLFKQAGFAEIDDVLHIIVELDRRLEMATRPQSIFLSHRGVDKDLVREFKNILQVLKFEPWLDENAMPAGVPLEDALLEGFKQSCAAVFFITPSFKKSSYLDTEVRYAIMEWRKRPDHFTIIPLVFTDKDGQEGFVPPLLQQFVYKKPLSHLDALRELILALPLSPTTPEWKTS